MSEALLHIEVGDSVAEKVSAIQTFLGEHFFHECGIMYSAWLWDGPCLRPFCEEDFERYDLPVAAQESSPCGYYHGEDSAMVSGAFLYSQALRHERTGDETAMDYAVRAFDSLNAIFELSERGQDTGFLCKPYDWAYSEHTSPDQYICAFNGLWRFRAITDHARKKRIDFMIPSMADWWRQRAYTLNYFGIEWPILPHHSPAMAALNSMAWKITADHTYLNEMRRLLALAEAWPTWIDRNRRELYHCTGFPVEKQGVRWPESYYGLEYDPARREYLLPCCELGEIWYTALCADYFMRENEVLSSVLKNAVARMYKYIQFGLREDLLTYYSIQVDLEKDNWHILPVPPGGDTSLLAASGRKCYGIHAARIPDTAIIAHIYAPEYSPGALNLSRSMFQVLDNSKLKWITATDEEHPTKRDTDCMKVLGSDILPALLIAYWRGKQYGLDYENNQKQ